MSGTARAGPYISPDTAFGGLAGICIVTSHYSALKKWPSKYTVAMLGPWRASAFDKTVDVLFWGPGEAAQLKTPGQRIFLLQLYRG